MASCVIVCAGAFRGLAEPLEREDLLIAADGGYRHCIQAGLDPQVVLGDFDSLGFVPEGAEVYPVEKDDTDTMLAVRQGLSRGYRRFLIYGGMEGPRIDHALANFQTLLFLAEYQAQGFLIGQDQIATVVKNGALRLPARREGTVSVFCLGEDARGVCLRGLRYGLEDGTLTASYPMGVSNGFVGQAAQISVRNGRLLVLYPREVGPC